MVDVQTIVENLNIFKNFHTGSMYLLMNTAHEQQSPDLLEKICGMIDECYLSENMLTPERISVN